MKKNSQQLNDKVNRDAYERTQTLREFVQIVSSSLDHRVILQKSLKQLSHILDFDSASIYLLPYRNQSEFVAGIGFEDEALTTYEAEILLKDSPVIQYMANTQKPILSADVNDLDGWVWVRGAENVRSFMGIPLVANGETIGALMFDGFRINQFAQADLEAVSPLAQQIAIAVENARLFEEVRDQLFLSYTLQQIGTLLTTSLSLDAVYEHLFDLLAKVVAYDSVTIQILDTDGKTLRMASSRGFPEVGKTRDFLANIKNPLRKFDERSRWRLINDTLEEPMWVAFPRDLGVIRSWIGAKLIVKERLIGLLNIDHQKPHAYTKADAETVAAFANQAAVAIENARLHDETRRRANELKILHDAALQTSTIVNVDMLLSETTQMIAARLSFDSFGFVLNEEDSGNLVVHPSYHGVIEPEPGALVSWVADKKQSRMVFEPISELAVPVMVGERFLGVFHARCYEVNAFSQDDLRFLETLALQVATAVERAQLYEALQRHADDLKAEVARQTAELKSEQERTLAILESAGEGIFLTDLDANILYVNPAMVRQSGYMRSELLGNNPRILQSPSTPAVLFRDLWQTLRRGETWRGELVNRRKDGQLYDVNMAIVPLRDANDQIVNYVSVQSDISRIKEVERLKSRFVSNVSHELRTPLTNITTYLQLMEKGREERRTHYLEVLNAETRRLTRLIQDLLDLSQLETEPILDTAVFTNLVSEATTHFKMFTAQAEAKAILFTQQFPAEPVLVNIANRHLGQLINNLLGNAFAYTPEGGTITVAIGLDESVQEAYFAVRDTGRGIPEAEIPHLFDRFFRGTAVLNTGVPGTGLGLAICKEITDRWRGRIEVESQLGVGTRFTVWLPIFSER